MEYERKINRNRRVWNQQEKQQILQWDYVSIHIAFYYLYEKYTGCDMFQQVHYVQVKFCNFIFVVSSLLAKCK